MLRMILNINVDGNEDEMFDLLKDYVTSEEAPLMFDYGPDAWGGWEGPFITNIEVERG